ncbi:MAG: translation initiation factor IF-2 associated domain-containing protein, partial [Bosea sp. (in: a-proteobacteria)]
MSDTKTPGDKTLSVSPPKTLTLKRPLEQSVVRQSFSHGRSKQVVVEVKRRLPGHGADAPAAPAPVRAPVAAPVAPPAPVPVARQTPAAPRPTGNGLLLRTLSDEEKDARTRALADSHGREAEDRKRAEEEARQRAAREEKDKIEREAVQARQREEEERRRQEDERKRRGHDEARRRLGEEIPVQAPRPVREIR